MSERKETPDVLGNLLGSAPAEQAPPAAAPTRKPAQPKPPAAQKPAAAPVVAVAPQQWEYREVIFRDFRGWRPRAVDGRERANWKEAPLILDYLRQAGAEGWELVSIGNEHNYEKTAYFKRPAPK